jgi:C1A family cysteine protease
MSHLIVSRHGHVYNTKRDVYDPRDKFYHQSGHFLAERVAVLPPVVSLRKYSPPIYDQLQIGACTGNAWARLRQFIAMKEALADATTPSRRFIYHKEMVLEGDCNGDNGAQVRTGGVVLSTVGSVDESAYPYSNNIADFLAQPSNALFGEAYFHKLLTPLRITQDLPTMKECLAAGYPFVIGFTVYQSFESDAVAANGMMPMPAANEQVLGEHCVVVIGYNDTLQRMECANSWNTNWGDAGYFWMPYPYIVNSTLASDFWTGRAVS